MTFTQKGFTKNFLKMMKQLENLCCLLPDGGGGGFPFIVGANEGASADNNVIKLGQAFDQVGDPAIFTEDREIPLDGNTLALRDGHLLLGPDHWSDPYTLLTANDYTEIEGSGNVRDDSYLAMWEKQWLLDDNANFTFFKANSTWVGYIKPDANLTMPADHQHNTFAGVYGGGFLSKTGVALSNITGGSSFTNASNVTFHKFLVQGTNGDSKILSGYWANQKFSFEATSNIGSISNYTDILAGHIQRNGTGANYIISTKYGLYLLPIKADANIAVGYGIYQEGVNDRNYYGGKIGISNLNPTYNLDVVGSASFGKTHWSGLTTRIASYIDNTYAASATSSPDRAIFLDKTVTLGNNTAFTSFSQSFLNTSYMVADANTSFTNDYQNASIIGGYFAAGFLSKGGVPTQNISAGNTVTGGLTNMATKFLFQSGDTKVVTGFIENYRSMLELRSTGTMENYIDMVLGVTLRFGQGANMVITNKYGLYINDVKDSANTTNGWAIYSIGASDKSYIAGQVGIGTNAAASAAKVQIDSTTQGFLPPRMTTTERDNIVSPVAGLVIYNTTTNKLNVYTTTWEAVTSA